MPKMVTEQERELTRKAIQQSAVSFIREKGTRAVTVDDIAGGAGIGKGSFYGYYSSKEECLYEAIKICEQELFSRMEEIMASNRPERERIVRFLKDVVLAEDSLILAVSPGDLEILLRKLPPEYGEREKRKSSDYFQRSLELMAIGEEQMETVALLLDCVGYAASKKSYSTAGTGEALDILVDALAEYICGRKKG